ncbi:MAG: GxxExxY protein [Verrucomicrobiia bacterium]
MEPNEFSSKVVGAAITVHKELGPGLLESLCPQRLCVRPRLRLVRWHSW